jgi:hypothetical protein
MSTLDKQNKKSNLVTRFVGDVLSTEKKIGDLNGKWAVMLKMTVLAGTVVAPLIVAWTIWVTSNIFSTQFHVMDTHSFEQRIMEIEKTLTATPERINKNAEALYEVKTEVKDVQKSNATDHQLIMVELSKIQTKLEMIDKAQ